MAHVIFLYFLNLAPYCIILRKVKQSKNQTYNAHCMKYFFTKSNILIPYTAR